MIAKSGLTVDANPMRLAAKREIGWLDRHSGSKGWMTLVGLNGGTRQVLACGRWAMGNGKWEMGKSD